MRVLGLELVLQHRHPDTCAHMDVAAPAECGKVMCVTVRRETQCHIDDYRLQAAGLGGSGPHCNCNWVRRCVVGTAFHLAQIHFSLVEGRPPDGRLPGSHQPHEDSKVRYAW